MKPMVDRRCRRPRQRGAILAFTGMALLTLVGMAVVGVDLGRLAFTATEVQTVAEVAATGYAHAWLKGVSSGTDPGDGPCQAEALQVVDGNRIDGQQAAASNIESYERGYYNFATNGPFTTAVPSGETANAVRATGTATVTNFFSSIFNTPQSTVRKNAVATLTCGKRARPLPLAVQDCQFDAFEGPEDCSELAQLTEQTVKVDNACWTNLGGSSFDIVPYINSICGLGGTSETPPSVQEGQVIDVSEGNHTNACQAIRDCYDLGITDFTVPIVGCFDDTGDVQCATQGSGHLPITGFARIEIDSRPICTGTPKTMSLHYFCNTDPTEGVGGSCDFGNFKVAMVE